MTFMKREDVNLRVLNLQTAKGIYIKNTLGQSRVRAFILDDPIKYGAARKWKASPVTLTM